jgi:hypothetical protein
MIMVVAGVMKSAALYVEKTWENEKEGSGRSIFIFRFCVQ